MNLIETKNLIFNFFKENDTIILPDDFLKIVTVSGTPELDKAKIEESLKCFVDTGLAKKISYIEGEGKSKKDKTAYVLEKPLQSYEQSLTISGETAFYISNILNDVKDKDDQNAVNPLSITETNIESLIILISQLLKEFNENKKNKEEDLDFEN